MSKHGSYNGWCRVEGVPLHAADCAECREVDKARAGAERIAAAHRIAMARIAKLEDALYATRQRARNLDSQFEATTINGKAGDDLRYTYDDNGGLRVLPREGA